VRLRFHGEACIELIAQTRISDVVRGRIDRFSIDSLVQMLGRAGLEVRLTTRRRARVA